MGTGLWSTLAIVSTPAQCCTTPPAPANRGNQPTDMHTVNCLAYGPVTTKTISQALAENRLVEVTRQDDGTFIVREMCDEWYVATLTPEQLAEWGKELIELSGKPCPEIARLQAEVDRLSVELLRRA